MKKWIGLTALMLLAGLLFAAPALSEEAVSEPAEWTVMFYFCGSDLESRHGLATENLKDITEVIYPANYIARHSDGGDAEPDADMASMPGIVNVLVETGGSEEWHARDIGMDIDPAALQRWRYNMYGVDERITSVAGNGFELMQTLPLQSMADPGTLADFIRWGVETCPAKKYALVLWDHGDGARSGLIIDELFDRDILYLYELKQALADGGARFEAVVIDACLMANIETAWNIKDHASWLVASEEIVPGKGTAIGDWLQELMCYPEGDGEWLGRLVCDTTSIKYANEAQQEAKSTLTWSVTDLSRVDALVDSAERFYRDFGETMRRFPQIVGIFLQPVFDAPEYGDGQQNMRDLGGLVYKTELALFSRRSLRNEVIQALSDAVTYCVRGTGRSDARGLTYCYPAGFSDAELDIYAQNYPMPEYLAFIDSITDWNAPEWVYETAERLPSIDEIEGFKVLVKRKRCDNGKPAILVRPDLMPNVNTAYYRLYRLDEDTGELLRMGRTSCRADFAGEDSLDLVFVASDPMHWPAIDGELVCMDLIETQSFTRLYNIPAMIGTQPSVLRCGRHVVYADDEAERINDYEIYGVWEGYEENSTLLNRSVQSLSETAGREYQLLYPIDGTEESGRTMYGFSAPLKMYKALDIEEIPMPEGTYYLEYGIEDVFMRDAVLERIEIHWDGEQMTFPDDLAWDDDEWIDFAELRNR